MKVNNLTAKHCVLKASTHPDRKKQSKRVRGGKHKCGAVALQH
jgi:hypothetical protein